MNVILRGKSFSVTVDDVLHVTSGVDPAPLARYAVKLHGRWFPPKQVMSLLTRLPVAAFTTQDAYRTMQRLGLEIVEAHTISDGQEERP